MNNIFQNCLFDNFNEWLDCVLQNNLPLPGVAVCFNIYEEKQCIWAIEIITADSFDGGEDWACNEVFSSGDNCFIWEQKSTWQEIHKIVCEMIEHYLDMGKYASALKKYQGIAVGFVDGDLELVFQ